MTWMALHTGLLLAEKLLFLVLAQDTDLDIPWPKRLSTYHFTHGRRGGAIKTPVGE
jgi:hypothetical protein